MATVDPSQYPTAPLDNLRKLAPGDLLHSVTSSTRSAASVLVVPSSASSQLLAASRSAELKTIAFLRGDSAESLLREAGAIVTVAPAR